MAAGFRLGIDFGTSHTVAVLEWPDGRVRPMLFDGSPLLPSAVFADPSGQLVTGRDALHAARTDPARFEPSPKRRVDDGNVLLGDREFAVPQLVAAVLRRVADEAGRVSGHQPMRLVLTHPASWGPSRKFVLIDAARRAGLPEPELVPEPVAAASYFVEVLGKGLPPTHPLIVYDFGGGTFDVSVVGSTGLGYEVRAVEGLDQLGGLDLDALVVDRVGAPHQGRPEWQRVVRPETTEDRRHHRQLWDDARAAKEMLSRSPATSVTAPLVGGDAHISRDEFEAAARPLVEQTVRVTEAILPSGYVAGIFLVGGSSRIPLVAALLEHRTGIRPTTIEQPEMVVAEGSLRATRPVVEETTVPLARPAPPPVPRPRSQPVVVDTRRRRRWPAAVAGALTVLLLGAIVGYAVSRANRDAPVDPGAGDTTNPTASGDRPAWVPAAWTRFVADSETTPYFVDGPTPNNGGECRRQGGTVLRVSIPQDQVAGCAVAVSENHADVAVEARVAREAGCGVMWVRTGAKGYMLRLCASGTYLHRLADDPALPENTIGQWAALPATGSTVGLLAQDTTLSVYADGQLLGSVTDPPGEAIPQGRVNIGVFGQQGSGVAVFTGFRAWEPTG